MQQFVLTGAGSFSIVPLSELSCSLLGERFLEPPLAELLLDPLRDLDFALAISPLRAELRYVCDGDFAFQRRNCVACKSSTSHFSRHFSSDFNLLQREKAGTAICSEEAALARAA